MTWLHKLYVNYPNPQFIVSDCVSKEVDNYLVSSLISLCETEGTCVLWKRWRWRPAVSACMFLLLFRLMDRNYQKHLSGVRNTKEHITSKSSLKHGTHIIMYSDVYLNSYQWWVRSRLSEQLSRETFTDAELWTNCV